jgi:hypothetical protein
VLEPVPCLGCLSRPEEPLLAEITPDPITPELAPFVAHAQADLEQATEGLEADEAIAHLEATMVRAEVEASRLGFRFPPPELELDQASLTEGGNPVVVIQRLTESDAG